MSAPGPKDVLHRYLRQGREVVVWKLEGLGEYDIRRPMTPTGTNLLGLVKHLAIVDSGYFGEVFGRPFAETVDWFEAHPEPDADMWATADESREAILALYERATAHSDATISELDLDAPGTVGHWPAERAEVTLQQMLVHVTTETHRHAGHADICRELADGAVGHRPDHLNLGGNEAARLLGHRARLDREARRAAGMT
ncbi:DinB family protein [Actinomycetospora endophytica]|uniref:DinB family protein n=1 Tax=Actinomycetospora endophytica TaxID=2291215 RepID=A0ABS8PIH2_9PSEU|nr:DinB family protein [Actinomycetospora endophytica]MCD2198051.1 DinB family protein [Actinomycetospora endophytica]